jgi:uncharacterized protein with PQ loop repeat
MGVRSTQASSCEDANIFVIKASPSALTNAPYLLFLNLCFMFHYDCALSLYELYGTVVALRLTFLFILFNPIIRWNIISTCFA